MRRRSPAVRLLAFVLMLAQSQACGAPAWKSTGGVTPTNVVQGWRPDSIRVLLLDGRNVTVAEPRMEGDSIVGLVKGGQRDERVAFSQTDMRSYEWHGSQLFVELLSGDTVRLRDAWQRGDSAGGTMRVAQPPLRRAFALDEVVGVRVRELPPDPARETPSPGEGVLWRGERIRVQYDAGGRLAVVEGTFGRFNGDTLVVVREAEPPSLLPLATIQRVEAQVGTKSNAAPGFLIGLLAGGAIVGLGAAIASGQSDNGSGAFSSQALTPFVAGGLGIGVFLIATIGGVASRHDRWTEVPLDALRGMASPPPTEGAAR